MKCPRCVQRVAPGGASCPHCGYSLELARSLYGWDAVVAGRLMDVEGCLQPEWEQAMLASLAEFSRLFPQLFLLMYLGPLPAPASPRQFAFWLLNHAAVPDLEVTQPNEHGLVLVVDPRGGTAVLSGGYFIENFIRQDELDAVLKSAAKDFARLDWPVALQSILTSLGGLLKRRAKEVLRHPGKFQAPRPEEAPTAFPPLLRTGEVSLPPPGPSGVPSTPKTVEPAIPPAVAPVAKPVRSITIRAKSAARRASPRRR